MTTQFLAPNSDVAARQGDIDMLEPRFSGSSLRTGDLATNPTTLSTLSIETMVPDHEVFRRRFPIPVCGGPFHSPMCRTRVVPNSCRIHVGCVAWNCAGSIGVSDVRFRA
jgi:hypothetical protein